MWCRNKYLGAIMIALGTGLLLGMLIPAWFLTAVLGAGLICVGFILLKRN